MRPRIQATGGFLIARAPAGCRRCDPYL